MSILMFLLMCLYAYPCMHVCVYCVFVCIHLTFHLYLSKLFDIHQLVGLEGMLAVADSKQS